MLLVFALTVPASILFTKYRTKKVKPLFKERSVKLGELNGFVEEKISGQKTVKAYNAEETMKSRFENKNDLAVEAYYRAEYLGSMVGPSVNFINNISMAMVSVLGTILYLYAMISIGDVSAFILYSRKFSGPINEAANIVTDLQSAVAAVSVGIVKGVPMLDLCYEEDSTAEVDFNVVMTGEDAFVEVQGTAEGKPFSRSGMDELMDLARAGIAQLFEAQQAALAGS